MELFTGILALMGLFALVQAGLRWYDGEREEPTYEDDLAAPYREALYASMRLHGTARDLEQQMFAEAARHMSQADDDRPVRP